MNSVLFENKRIIPSKVICVGRNYVEHIKELNNEIPDDIVLFIKPNSAITDRIIKPEKKCRYEGEISFIIENGNISGIGFGIDLTLIEEQEKAKKKGLPWEKAKAFDKSAVFSNFVKIHSLNNISMELYINGKIKQKADINLMIFKPKQILEKINEYFSLEDGDIIMTGTPKGVGTFNKEDIFLGRILQDKKILIEKKWIAE